MFFFNLKLIAGLEIRVVHHDVRMRDAALVVIVINDGDLERAERAFAPAEQIVRPFGDESPQRVDVDLIARIGADDELLIGYRGFTPV